MVINVSMHVSTFSDNCNRALCEIHGSNYVYSTIKPVSTKTVCKPARIVNCNKPVIFSPIISFFTLVILVLVKLSVAALAVNMLVP